MNNEIWRDVVADLASIVRVQNGNLHADINELLDRAEAVLATQPPQDERGQREPNQDWWNELISDINTIDCRYRGDPSYDHDAYWMRAHVTRMLEKRRDTEPAQPVALSTLTDMQLAAAAYDGYDEYWTEDSKGIQTEAWAASAKAVLALAASAPAQQATPPQPLAAEVPPGMALVPIEPTAAMVLTFYSAILEHGKRDLKPTWRALLEVASQDSAKETK